MDACVKGETGQYFLSHDFVNFNAIPIYMRLLCVVFLLVVVAQSIAFAQKVRRIAYQTAPNEAAEWQSLKLPDSSPDSATTLRLWRQIIIKVHQKGYLTASIDSVEWTKDTVHVRLHLGRLFRWTALRRGNASDDLLRETGFRERLYRSRPLRHAELVRLEEAMLRHADEHGYPFATVRLDSLEMQKNGVSAALDFQKGVKIVFDTVRIEGTARLRRRFVENWLRLYPGQPYSQSRLDQADALLRQQPFLVMSQPYKVVFKNDRAYVTFQADAGRASEADGIIGFQPNEQTAGRLLLTGELNLRLRNLFASGGSFAFSWQQIRRGSPRLNVAFSQPAFLGTPLEVNASFQLLREDTALQVQNGFLVLNQQAAVHYNLDGYHKIGLGIDRRTSRLADSTVRLPPNSLTPQQTNTAWLSYRAFYQFNRLDNFFYPRRGWQMHATAAIGNKQVLDAEQLDVGGGSISRSSPQFSYQATVRRFVPLRRRATLLAQCTGGQIFNENLFQNDLFRLGGLNSLRGFNENFFFASDYVTATLEYRFFWEPTSYLFAFYDQAWLQTRIIGSRRTDAPSGVGAGVSFATRAGVFNVVYALGNSRERALGLNFSKIHFGLVSRF